MIDDMADNLSKADRRRTMRAVKGKRTGLERRVSGMLAGRGFQGWETNPAGVVGKPDIVFRGKRVAIFVDGCFWHGCPKCHRPLPATNVAYWRRKIARNIKRDAQLRRRLRGAGWRVVRVWEHELVGSKGLRKVATKIGIPLRKRRKKAS